MLAEQLLNQVREYIRQTSLGEVLGLAKEVSVSFLAQGEYNLNYLLQSGERKYVLRINTGSQMGLDNQIAYEYQALRLLNRSQVTPRALYLDDTRAQIPYGMLVMEYLPGVPLDYRCDLTRAARTLARIHGLEYAPSEVEFLAREPGPLTGLFNEAAYLLETFFTCQSANPRAVSLLKKIIAEAEERKQDEKYLLAEPWLRVINRDVNSRNFIVNAESDECFLIDWERPIYGEPAQDLSHFLIVTTTLWKTDYIINREEEDLFIGVYADELDPCPQAKTLQDRVEMFKYFNLLRAVAWCAMAWTEYIKPGRPLSNQDTFQKIERYIEPEFVSSVFCQQV